MTEGYRTATLDLKSGRKKGSIPLADTEDEVMQGYGGQDFVSESTQSLFQVIDSSTQSLYMCLGSLLKRFLFTWQSIELELVAVEAEPVRSGFGSIVFSFA